MPELIILLPTKNEELGIGEVIDRIPRNDIKKLGYKLRIVVIDGASTDSTCKIANSKGAQVIRQKSAPGKGWGFREAVQVIFRGDYSDEDLLIMLDSDATYYPEDIPRFIAELRDSEVVWGSRLRGEIEDGAMSSVNKMGNRILSSAASLLFMKRTTDLCTGFWGFRAGSLTRLPLSAKGFNLEAELFSSVNKFQMKTKEIPINYANREGESNLKWYIDGPRILLTSFKKRFEYTRKPIHDFLYVSCFVIVIFSAL